MKPKKLIAMNKLWRGAVFGFQNGQSSHTVWYHCDFINHSQIHYTAIHNHRSFEKKIVNDFVILRS